jgi:hypothetical protein
MSAELAAYLQRLVHPARRKYASAYAEHILTGAAAPKVPKGLDHETADKIARKVRKYAALTPLDRSPVRAAQTPPEPVHAIPDGLLALPETLRLWAAKYERPDLLEILAAHGLEAEVPPVDTDGGERMADHYTPEYTPAIIDSGECDALDITDLEPYLARTLAFKLTGWNGPGPVYERRNGRRYISRRIKCIDLNDPTVQQVPSFSDLAHVVRERGVHVN